MSSTNHTTNYNLPQWVGSDKPAWLGDVNPAFSAIDTAMKANDVTATAASTAATTANTNIGTMASLETTEKSSLVGATNEVNTKAGTAQTTANNAVTAASNVDTKLNNFEKKFNLTASVTDASVTVTRGTVVAQPTLAQNSDGSIFKFYGTLQINPASNGSSVNYVPIAGKTGKTGIATGCFLSKVPSAAYTIKGGVIKIQANASTGVPSDTRTWPMTIGTDGQIYLDEDTGNVWNIPAGEILRLIMPPCIYFNDTFGDEPDPE